jgi:hypothetical protein
MVATVTSCRNPATMQQNVTHTKGMSHMPYYIQEDSFEIRLFLTTDECLQITNFETRKIFSQLQKFD